MAQAISDQFLCGVRLQRDGVESFNVYPYNLPAFEDLDELEFHPKVTFIIGENGMGKSTLLEAVATAWGFNPEGGSLNFNFATKATHSELFNHIKLIRGIRRPRDGFFLRAESFYNVATNIEVLASEDAGILGSYGGKSLHERSHGEAFFATFMNRFWGNGLYVLDEPEAALSPLRQLAMVARMHDLIRKDSQFVIATHSPIIMAYPDADIYQLSDGGITKVKYEDTEHFTVMRDFIVDRERMLRVLLE